MLAEARRLQTQGEEPLLVLDLGKSIAEMERLCTAKGITISYTHCVRMKEPTVCRGSVAVTQVAGRFWALIFEQKCAMCIKTVHVLFFIPYSNISRIIDQ